MQGIWGKFQINEIEPLGSSENTWSWEKTLPGLVLMSCLPDGRAVSLRWWLWEQQRIGLCPVPFSSNKCGSVVGGDWNPQYSCFHCTAAIKHKPPWLLLASVAFPMEFKSSSTKPFKDVAVAPFISVGLPKAWGLFPFYLCEKFSAVWW